MKSNGRINVKCEFEKEQMLRVSEMTLGLRVEKYADELLQLAAESRHLLEEIVNSLACDTRGI